MSAGELHHHVRPPDGGATPVPRFGLLPIPTQRRELPSQGGLRGFFAGAPACTCKVSVRPAIPCLLPGVSIRPTAPPRLSFHVRTLSSSLEDALRGNIGAAVQGTDGKTAEAGFHPTTEPLTRRDGRTRRANRRSPRQILRNGRVYDYGELRLVDRDPGRRVCREAGNAHNRGASSSFRGSKWM